MKKLKLNFSDVQGDILSREDLKKIMGGDFGSDDGDADTPCKNKTEENCTTTTSCSLDCNGETKSGNCKWNTVRLKCACSVVCVG